MKKLVVIWFGGLILIALCLRAAQVRVIEVPIPHVVKENIVKKEVSVTYEPTES